jgi:hypothetical protein
MLRMCIVGSQYVKSQLKSKLDNCIKYVKMLDFLEVLILWSRPYCCLCARNCDLLGSHSCYVLRYPLYWMNLGISRLFVREDFRESSNFLISIEYCCVIASFYISMLTMMSNYTVNRCFCYVLPCVSVAT